MSVARQHSIHCKIPVWSPRGSSPERGAQDSDRQSQPVHFDYQFSPVEDTPFYQIFTLCPVAIPHNALSGLLINFASQRWLDQVPQIKMADRIWEATNFWKEA